MLTKLSQAITITAWLYLIMNLSQVTTVQPAATSMTGQPPTNAASQVKPLPQLVEFVQPKP